MQNKEKTKHKKANKCENNDNYKINNGQKTNTSN